MRASAAGDFNPSLSRRVAVMLFAAVAALPPSADRPPTLTAIGCDHAVVDRVSVATENYAAERPGDYHVPFTVSSPTAMEVITVSPRLGNPLASAGLNHVCTKVRADGGERYVRKVKMSIIDQAY